MMVGIVNSGFPEAFHNDTALAILRRFAAETGFQWAGGLALGGGGTIDKKHSAGPGTSGCLVWATLKF